MSIATASTTTYRPDIDGLRAIAVMAVVLFHMGLDPVPGGFVGVDVFFVISGYLISGHLFKQAGQGHLSLMGFYEKRFRRLFPALLAMLAVSIVVFAFILTPVDFKAFGHSVLATVLSVSNVLFFLRADYFDPASELKPLLHTWSLGVEEQFYLVFPLLVMATRRWPMRAVGGLMWALALASLVWSSLGARAHPEAVFYLPFARFWELLTGVLLVVHQDFFRRQARWGPWLTGAGLALLAVAIAKFEPEAGYPGWQATLPCLGAALVIAGGEAGLNPVAALLGKRPWLTIGLISYSMYLWHWPLLVAARYLLLRELTGAEQLCYLVLLTGLSWASWRWVEVPARGTLNARPWSRRTVFAMVGASLSVATAFALSVHLGAGVPDRWADKAQAMAAATLDVNPQRLTCDRMSPDRVRQDAVCHIGDQAASTPTFAVLGDSFGDALVPGLDAAGRESGRQGVVLTHSGCFPLVGVHQKDPRCHAFSSAVVAYIDAHPDIRQVVVISRWTSALLGTRFGQFRGDGIFITDELTRQASYDENKRVFNRGFQRMLDALKGRQVTIVAFIPEQKYDIPRALALKAQFGLGLGVPLPTAEHLARQAALRSAISHLGLPGPQHALIDVGAFLCDAHECQVQSGDAVLYADDNHLSRSGALHVRELFRRAVGGP